MSETKVVKFVAHEADIARLQRIGAGLSDNRPGVSSDVIGVPISAAVRRALRIADWAMDAGFPMPDNVLQGDD